MGKNTGVATRLKQQIGNHHVTTHCVAHNLELALTDAIKEVPYYSKFEDTVKGIFKFYFYSPKKRRELSQISELLDEDRVRYGGVKAIRWLASQHRALQALQKHYAATVYHLENTTSSKGEDGARAKGLLKEMKKEHFVKLLHYMIDEDSSTRKSFEGIPKLRRQNWSWKIWRKKAESVTNPFATTMTPRAVTSSVEKTATKLWSCQILE